MSDDAKLKKAMLLKLIAELSMDDLNEMLLESTSVKEEQPQPEKKKRKQKRRGKKQEVSTTSPEPLKNGKKNHFDDMTELHEMFKDETEAQKKIDPIYKGKKPVARRAPDKMVQSSCLRCGTRKKVHAKFLIKDLEDDRVGFICNRCVGAGKK